MKRDSNTHQKKGLRQRLALGFSRGVSVCLGLAVLACGDQDGAENSGKLAPGTSVQFSAPWGTLLERDLMGPIRQALSRKRAGALQDLFVEPSMHRFPIPGAGASARPAGLSLRRFDASHNSDLNPENLARQWLAYFAGWDHSPEGEWRSLAEPEEHPLGGKRLRWMARFEGRHQNGSLQAVHLEMEWRVAANDAGQLRIANLQVLRGMQGFTQAPRFRSIGHWVGLQAALSQVNREGLARSDQGGALHRTGLTATDWDEDGFPDILWTRHGQTTRLFRNDGSSGFVPASLPLQVPKESPGFLLSVDLDGDQNHELVGTRFLRFDGETGFLALYTRGTGNLWRLEESALAIPVGLANRHSVVHSITPVDLDSDGRLDLVLAMGGEGQRWNPDTQRPEFDSAPVAERNYVLRNLGGLRFQEAGESLGLGEASSTRQVAGLDWNGDGIQDLYEANAAPFADRLWLGGPNGQFSEPVGWFDVAQAAYVPHGNHRGAWPFELHGRARSNLLVLGSESNKSSTSTIPDPREAAGSNQAQTQSPAPHRGGNLWLEPDVSGHAHERAASLGLAHSGDSIGVLPLDLGNRGALDLGIYSSDPEKPALSVFVHSGASDGYREEVAYLLGLGDLPPIRAALPCDVDGDGDQDLVIAADDGSLHLLADVGPSGGSLQIELEPKSGTSWGARVEVTCSGKIQTKRVYPMIGPTSQGLDALHFGVGSAERVEEVRVFWPSGHVDHWEDLSVGVRLRLRETRAYPRSAPPLQWSTSPRGDRALPQIGGYARLLDGKNHPLGDPSKRNLVHIVGNLDPLRPLPWSTQEWPGTSDLEVSLLVMDADRWLPEQDAPYQAYVCDNAILREFLGDDQNPRLPATFVFSEGGRLVRAFPSPPSENDLRGVIELAAQERGFPEWLVRQGFEALQERRYDDALRTFGAAIESDSTRLDAYMGLAHTHRYLGQIDSALLALSNATHVDPDFALAHSLLGSLQISQGSGAQAMKSFQRMLALNGDSARSWFSLSEAAIQAEQWEAALHAVDKTLALLEANTGDRAIHADAHCARGKLLERSKERKQAALAYQAALTKDPEHPEALDGFRRLSNELR